MAISRSCDRATTAHIWVLRLLTLVAAAWLLPAAAQTPPARDGNRWDGIAHQPTRAGVAAAEQRAGVAPTYDERRRQDTELQRLGDRDLRNAGAAP